MKIAKPAHVPQRKPQGTPARHEDGYRADAKIVDPVCCPRCGATFLKGRWTWKASTDDVPRRTCPACLRIEQHQPAGFVSLGGAFFQAHREEIMKLVASHEARERAQHPMQRLIGAEEQPGGVLVTTTDSHLARGIAVAIHDAYQGNLDLDFGPGENFVRATWTR